MIELKDFAREIESGLNNNTYGIEFAVFTDAAKYEKALISRTKKKRFTNCLITAGTSTILPTQALTVATQQAVIEICVQLSNPETDEEIIAAHRAILDTYFQQTRVDEMSETIGTTVKKYAVSAVYSLATTGNIEQRPFVGTSLTFTINADWAYVEDGLNSLNCTFELDGFIIPYTTAKITKLPQAQSDAYSDDSGRATSVNVSFVRSFDFFVPAQNKPTGVGAIVIEQLLNSQMNTPHMLIVKPGDNGRRSYSVVFGEADITLEGINNAGIKFSLIERMTGS